MCALPPHPLTQRNKLCLYYVKMFLVRWLAMNFHNNHLRFLLSRARTETFELLPLFFCTFAEKRRRDLEQQQQQPAAVAARNLSDKRNSVKIRI